MGLWKYLFGKKPSKKLEKSPYLPKSERPLDISFAENFPLNGGYFLYNDSIDLVNSNFKEICFENNWSPKQVVCLNQNLSDLFQTSYVDKSSGKLNHFEALLIKCEYLICNTGKFLLSNKQINHFKLNDLPKTIIVSAKMNQLTRDLSQGMTLLKNKYKNSIPTNITTLKTVLKSKKEKKDSSHNTNSKIIYLLLEDF